MAGLCAWLGAKWIVGKVNTGLSSFLQAEKNLEKLCSPKDSM